MMQERSPFKRKARERYSEEDWRMHRWAYARLTERVDWTDWPAAWRRLRSAGTH